jgi:hypothetical protein
MLEKVENSEYISKSIASKGRIDSRIFIPFIQPFVQKDRLIMQELLDEMPYLKNLSRNEWYLVFERLYNEPKRKIYKERNNLFLVDKCWEAMKIAREACDKTTYVSYGICIATGIASFPATAIVTTLCVAGVLANAAICYEAAQKSYDLCKMPDVN